MKGQFKRVGWIGLAVIEVCIAAAHAVCQAPATGKPLPRLIPRTPEQREQRYVALHRVILNVQVSDGAGKPVTDLKQSDFTLLDNDRPRALVSFRTVDGAAGAAHAVLVLDTANNFTRTLRNQEQAIEKYLSASNEPLPIPVAIGIFNGLEIGLGPASRDRSALLDDLKSRSADVHSTGCITRREQPERMGAPFTPGGPGSSRAISGQELACQNDRFVASVSALARLARSEADVPGRMLLIWLGPGWPMLTNKAFAPDPPDLKRNFFDQLVSVSTVLKQAQITLDAVSSPDESIDPQTPNVRDSMFFAGVANEEQASAAQFGLHVLAHQTGGRIFGDSRDVPAQIAACIADAESYYVLTFDSPRAESFGEYHALAVKVDQPGFDVRAYTLYYGEQ